MFHGCLHVVGDPAPAARGADEELHQGEQGGLAVLLVAVDPVVDNNLKRISFDNEEVLPIVKSWFFWLNIFPFSNRNLQLPKLQ